MRKKMLNKCASQGSNDDYKHLIQVNARKFNLFALHEIFLCKQEKFILLDSFVFWVSWQEKKGLWPISVWNGIFSHDLAWKFVFKLTLSSFLSPFRFTRNGRIIIWNVTSRNAKSLIYQSMHVMDYFWQKLSRLSRALRFLIW